MATDPYNEVQQEIQTSLQTATQLRASYQRIRNMARDDSEELMWARNELKATLAALEADLEDLEESVRIVESTDAHTYGLDDTEVANRRRYVEHVRREIQNMRAEVSPRNSNLRQPDPLSQNQTSSSPAPTGRRSVVASPRPDPDDPQRAWAREEQQMIMENQDRTIDTISGTLSTLAQQAGLIGQEISEHIELLDDLERGVDSTDTKLNTAMGKMKRFIRQSEEKGSGYCIVFLIIILMVLLLVIILV